MVSINTVGYLKLGYNFTSKQLSTIQTFPGILLSVYLILLLLNIIIHIWKFNAFVKTVY